MCKRGEIYYVDFGMNIDSNRQSGIRPVVVVSNNKANTYSPVITVVPLTTKRKKPFLPTHVLLPYGCGQGLTRNCMVLAEQVVTIDKKDLMEKHGEITDGEVMENITRALQVQIGVYQEYN